MSPDEYVKVAKTGRVYQIKLPMRTQSSKKKKTAINLNIYRNLHFRSLSAQKNNFAKITKKLLQGVPPLGTIALHYEVHPNTRRRLDTANVVSILDKYFSDNLTENGIIVDDNYEYVLFVSSGFGGLVNEEHVLVTITEIEPRKENTPMRILLDENDLKIALETYVQTLGISGASGVNLTADFEGVITAEVIMDSDELAPAATVKPKARRGGRTAGSKNKPKEPANVENSDEGSTDSCDGGDTPASEAPASSGGTKDDVPSTGAKATKNLFGDSETQSSEASDSAKEEVSGEEAPGPVKKKKSSIFDA